MAKTVQSLYFQADRFKPGVTYEEWDEQRPDPAPLGIEEAIKEDDYGTSERAQRSIVCAHERSWREKRQRIKRVPLDEKRLAYQQFCVLVEDQALTKQEDLSLKSLMGLFSACPKLQEVHLALRSDPREHPEATETAFERVMAFPHGDVDWEYQGIHQAHLIAQAAMLTRKTIQSLTSTLYRICSSVLAR